MDPLPENSLSKSRAWRRGTHTPTQSWGNLKLLRSFADLNLLYNLAVDVWEGPKVMVSVGLSHPHPVAIRIRDAQGGVVLA